MQNRVLCVDDDRSFLELTTVYLQEELPEITIETETAPEAALETVRTTEVACIVSDYDMPGMDGMTFFEAVREDAPRIPFILYTGRGSEEIAAEALNAGVTAYFQKGGPEQHRRVAHRVEQALTERRAQQRADRYSTVLKALGYPIYVTNAAGNFEFVNEAFADLTGYDRTTLLGSGVELIKDDAAIETVTEHLRRVLSSTGPSTEQVTIEITTKHGERIPCRDHIAALPFDEGFRGAVGILRELTDEQHRRHELHRQQQYHRELLDVLANDVTGTLNDLGRTLETVTPGEQLSETTYRALTDQYHRTDEQARYLRELGESSRPIDRCDVVCLSRAATQAWEQHGTDQATLQIGDDGELLVAPDRFEQLLGHLFENAIEHGPADVTVRVGAISGEHTGAPDTTAREQLRGDATIAGFYVADDGPGIAPARQPHVFEPGYTTTEDHTGFGLAVVKHIAMAHGWTVDIDDTRDGGTRVLVQQATDRPSLTGQSPVL